MQRELIYETWVPPAGVWSLWARPILFAQMPDTADEPPRAGDAASTAPWLTLDVAWTPRPGDGALLVIDLPGKQSVLMGLALAGRGYRPVPLYNACTGPREVIDQRLIVSGLRDGAAYLGSLALAADAPPTFLLDAHRMSPNQPVGPGVFDNRWKVFPQDFPSGQLLRARGITRAVLIQRDQRRPQEDLAHVLRRWQEAGLAIEAKDMADAALPQPISVARPAWYRAAWYRILATFGLARCPQGGFGYLVPERTQG